jgi:hypothetical protein
MEDIAKMETASQLSALASKLYEDLPKYAGVWNYPRVFPGFVEDLEQMLETVGRLLEDQEVWGAYDEWHRFMNRWDQILPTPLWVQVGTVIVDGPGPTVPSAYQPKASMDPKKTMDTQWELMKAFHTVWKTVANEVHEAFVKAGQTPPPMNEIVDVVRGIARGMDEAVKRLDLMEHWIHLVKTDAFEFYGIPT